MKHRAGWRVTQPDPGTFIWRSPLGGIYPTRGEILLPDLPEPEPTDRESGPAEPEAGTDEPPHTLEGPILYRPPPPPLAPPPVPSREYTDEPPF